MEAQTKQPPTAPRPGRRRAVLAVLAAATLLVGGRAAQLAWREFASADATDQAATQATLASAPMDPVRAGARQTFTPRQSPPADFRPEELTEDDLALLSLACPQSIESMPPEMQQMLHRVAPPHRLTAARELGGQWLVDPNAWFTAEDQADAGQAAPEPPAPSIPTPQQPQQPPESLPAPQPQHYVPDAPAGPALDALPQPQRRRGATPEGASPGEEPVEQPPVESRPIESPPVQGRPAGALAPGEPYDWRSPNGLRDEVEKTFGPENHSQAPPEELPPSLPDRSAPEALGPPGGEVVPPGPRALPPPTPARPAPQNYNTFTPTPPPGATSLPLSPHGQGAAPLTPEQQQKADESHMELFAKNCYPSAWECATCHKKQFEEWSLSSHSYSYISPMFQKFEQTITKLSRGTVGYFCQRCHSPTATSMNLPRDMPIWEMPQVAREGVTCIACHRINQMYSRQNGERHIVTGDIYSPIYGGIGGDGVAKAIANSDQYKVKTSPHETGAGQPIHTEGRFFEHLSKAEYCEACHQVAVHPGIKLEVVWEQYRASPACKKGIRCQDCHMGTIPGVPSPYEIGPIAELNGKTVNEHRKHANHSFWGPAYSIAHPGVYPLHKDAGRWRIPDWLLFDWRAGWGTEEFEKAVDEGYIQVCFPEVWQEADDRYDAREIIDDNLERLALKTETRRIVMENGTKVTGPHFRHPPRVGRTLKFNYVVTNINEGHNILTASLGAQPQYWANVALIGPDGRRLWETGYTDSNGDLADIHSVDVRHKRLKFDSQLFNLQTMFLITGATGTDREFTLPVNVSFDQVPQLRPGALPISVLNHPPFIRMESRSLAPLGSKRVKYSVPGHLLSQPGCYRLSFRMRSRTEPPYFMRFCGGTPDMLRALNEGILDVHTYSVVFEVK